MRLDTKKSTITTKSTAEERRRRFLSVIVYLASSSGSLLFHSSEVGRTLTEEGMGRMSKKAIRCEGVSMQGERRDQDANKRGDNGRKERRLHCSVK